MGEQLNCLICAIIGAAMMTMLLGSLVVYRGGWAHAFESGIKSNKQQKFFSFALFCATLSLIPVLLIHAKINNSQLMYDIDTSVSYAVFAFVPLLALILMQKKIKIYHWIATMGPAIALLILACTMSEDMRNIFNTSSVLVLLYMYILFIFCVYKLNKWDKEILDIHSDVSHRQTDWFRRLTVPIMILPIMWLPMDYNPGLNWLVIVYFLCTIIVFVGFIAFALRQEEALIEYFPENAEIDSTEEELEEIAKLSNTEIARPSWANKLDNLMFREKIYRQPDIDCNTLAVMIGTNRTYLSRYLNQVKGLTFYDYINSFRLEESMLLLRESDMSIDTIATNCGFRDRVTFYRTFRSQIGRSPSEWKKLIKSGDL